MFAPRVHDLYVFRLSIMNNRKVIASGALAAAFQNTPNNLPLPAADPATDAAGPSSFLDPSLRGSDDMAGRGGSERGMIPPGVMTVTGHAASLAQHPRQRRKKRTRSPDPDPPLLPTRRPADPSSGDGDALGSGLSAAAARFEATREATAQKQAADPPPMARAKPPRALFRYETLVTPTPYHPPIAPPYARVSPPSPRPPARPRLASAVAPSRLSAFCAPTPPHPGRERASLPCGSLRRLPRGAWLSQVPVCARFVGFVVRLGFILFLFYLFYFYLFFIYFLFISF
jgi:hypothetical protein